MVTILGSMMYLIEGGQNNGFDSIPRGIYWAIVTLTTVGYGDIIPVTNPGQVLSAIIMLLGYAIIAVPTRHCLRRDRTEQFGKAAGIQTSMSSLR